MSSYTELLESGRGVHSRTGDARKNRRAAIMIAGSLGFAAALAIAAIIYTMNPTVHPSPAHLQTGAALLNGPGGRGMKVFSHSGVNRLVVWNVLAHDFTAYNTPDGKKESEELKVQRWHQTLYTLKLLAPDAIALQEVTPSFLDFLVSSPFGLGQLGYEALFSLREGGKDGCATLYRKERFELLANTTPHFTAGPKPRLGLAAMLRDRESKGAFVLMNVHLEGAPDAGEVRLVQTKEALESVKALQQQQGVSVPTMLCGDFNAREENLGTEGIQQTAASHGLSRLPTPFTSVFQGKGVTIDHVFVSPPGSGLTVAGSPLVFPEFGRGDVRDIPYGDMGWPSDHMALVQHFQGDGN
eukprot:GDKI01031910.1.p1 GENE.GDKI01031910.1~~GDKI01031910.1.p1  ORF type:complete len:355 (+),score=109.36 GDKI01031910.1:69-1133(+)